MIRQLFQRKPELCKTNSNTALKLITKRDVKIRVKLKLILIGPQLRILLH